MFNKKTGLTATLAFSSILTLFGPAVASARDRNDSRQEYDYDHDGFSRNHKSDREDDYRNRSVNNARLEQRRNRNRRYTNGNYDSRGNEGYGYQKANGFYDSLGYWHQY